MKYLEIKKSNVYFKSKGTEIKPIDEISKEDILFIMEKSLEEDFEYDTYDNSLIQNQVHNIIYKDISKKLESFMANKKKMEEEINSQYKEAWDKYCSDLDDDNHANDGSQVIIQKELQEV